MAYRIEQNEQGGNDIVIDGWEAGISDSPYGLNLQTQVGNIQQTGLSDMRNVNIISIPGEVSVLMATSQASQTPIVGVAWSVAASNDTFTYAGTVLKNGTAVVLTVTSGATGITSGNTYWVQNATATTFQVGSGVDSDGTPSAVIDVTLNGTGTMTTVNMGAMSQIVSTDVNSFAKGGIGTSAIPSTSSVNSLMYGVDTNGRAWIFAPSIPNWIYLGNATVNASPPQPNGIAVWSGYILLFFPGDVKILYRAVGPTSSLSAWGTFKTGSGATGASGRPARTYTDVNSTIYWGTGSSIGSLIQLTIFDPTSAATYSYTATALLLPKNDVCNCLAEVGSNLYIGGGLNVLYIWNKDPLNAGNSSGFTPIFLPEATITRMVAVNSNAYLFVGNRGRIYITNGANVDLYQKMPDHLSGTVEPYYQWGGATYSRNQLYFGVSAVNSKSSAAISQYGGIWALSLDTKALRLVNKLSYGTYAGFMTEIAKYFSLTSAGGVTYSTTTLVSTWYDGVSVYGSDYTPSSPTPYSNYEAYVDSDLIPIGTYLTPATNNNVEFKLSVPMVAGEGIKLAYRQSFADSFTDITNGEFTTAGVYSGVVQASFQKSQWLQIRAYLKSTDTTPSYTRLRELRIR